MKKTWAIINLISVVLVLTINYLSQAFRWNNTTIGEMSDRYNSLFTPASYAFAIWGLIFLSLIAFVIFQMYRVFFSKKEDGFVEQVGPWFALANVLNAAWVVAFVYDQVGLSVLIMLGILVSLLMVVLRTNMERWDAPIEIIAFVWWPICLYSGWITVATIANISTYFIKLGWDGTPFSETIWTVALIFSATLINMLMIYLRNMREFAAVGVWALVAIFIRNQENETTIAYTALIAAIIIGLYSAYHGYQNRATNPFEKLRQRLQN